MTSVFLNYLEIRLKKTDVYILCYSQRACVFLQLTHQSTNSPSIIQFMININLLHVSAPGRYSQEILLMKGIETQHANLGILKF